MLEFEPVTYNLVNPIIGTVRSEYRTASWSIEQVTFNFLSGDQAHPPFWLVFTLHHALRDANGEEIPIEILSLLDLEDGMRSAFNQEYGAAIDAVDAE